MNFKNVPKVELHLHLDCSLSYDVVSTIDSSITEEHYLNTFVAPVKCTHLADFLLRAPSGIALMQTKEHISMVVKDLFRQLVEDRVIYAEIRFAPLQHVDNGLSAYEVVEAANKATEEAINETGIEARLILCTLRHYTEVQSMETVQLVEQFKGSLVAGFDIAANEAGYPIDAHIKAFVYAKQYQIFCTAHAGEACGAQSVWETLQYFGPSRIGHGVRSNEDENLVQHLIKNHIHLEICPTSNVQVNVCNTYQDHPVNKLYRAGVKLSLSTDARTISNINLNTEYQKMNAVFNWQPEDFFACNINAIKAAFIPEDLKLKLIKKLENSMDDFNK